MPKQSQPSLSVEEMVDLYNAGLSLDDIGLRAGVSSTVTDRLLRGAGIEIRKRGWRNKAAGAGRTYEGTG
jgi:hypothetical protein